MKLPLKNEELEYIDHYIKKTISNVKRSYYQNLKKQKDKRDISLDEVANDQEYAIMMDDPPADIFILRDCQIPICDPSICEALKSLTDRQRSVLLQNVVLQIPIREIADELGISIRVTGEHKQRAISAMIRRLQHE